MTSLIISLMIIIGILIITKKINNKDLNKQIKLLGLILLTWIIIHIIKYKLITNLDIKRYIWYLYYFNILFSANIFFNIGTYHNKNKPYIKIFKIISLIISSILFVIVITNDLHNLVFKFDMNSANLEANYTYGIGYYICFLWVIINIILSIYSTIKYSKGLYKKQKLVILSLIFLLTMTYAIGFIVKLPIILNFFKDFTLVYCTCYFLSLIIIVYKEKYRLTIEENLYDEIEEAIKDKTILINKIINNLPKSKNKKKDLIYIKLLISYCKRKSNLIVIQKNNDSYSSSELKLFIETALVDAEVLGVSGTVNIINNFEIPVYIASIIYSYIYNLFEYSINYKNTNILISIEKLNHTIKINTIIDPEEKIKPIKFEFELNKYIDKEKIYIAENEGETINIALTIPLENISFKAKNLSDKEVSAILQIKSKIHDILGQRLSVLSYIIEEDKINTEKINSIKPLLNNILDDLNNDNQTNPNEMLNQLIHTCQLTGTKLYIVGNLPDNYLTANTIVKIIRECCTNAIRHGKAKNIYVTIKDNNKIIISNDGKIPPTFNEGDGIKGIKLRVQELNGKIEIITSKNFTIIITL